VKTIYIECAGRIDRPSLSCRLVAPVAHDTYVQWPQLVPKVRRARYAGNVLSGASFPPRPHGDGTVFASVGTSSIYPFDRLVRAVGALSQARSVVIQRGISDEQLDGVESYKFLSFDQLARHVRDAAVVVTHAGIGSVLLALAHGKRPIVMPRSHTLGESVDDHQQAFAKHLEREGLATVVSSEKELISAVSTPNEVSPPRRPAVSSLGNELSQIVQEHLRKEAPRRRPVRSLSVLE
jgi:UDP-N-acetylglucosamine transferase subunit ALG13